MKKLALLTIFFCTTVHPMNLDLKLFKCVTDGNLKKLKTLMESDDAKSLVKKSCYQTLQANKGLRGLYVEDFKNILGGKMTLLHQAARYGRTEIVKYFIEEVGLDVNARCDDKTTPLIWASKSGNQETAEYLVHCANANITLRDKDGDNALDCAKKRNHQEIVNLLKMKEKINWNKAREIEKKLLEEYGQCTFFPEKESRWKV